MPVFKFVFRAITKYARTYLINLHQYTESFILLLRRTAISILGTVLFRPSNATLEDSILIKCFYLIPNIQLAFLKTSH